ncbi:MAG: LLM class flavin-dependent oxidoreductase [Pseudomonadota bacterium]
MHLGLTPWDMTPTTMAEQARLAEGWGYESIWLPENHFSGQFAVPDPLLLLASMAGATETIRLATTSFLLPLRHPLQAAEQVAVLDQVSNGRLILGLGRGYQKPTYAAFGIAMRQKREIFAQTLTTMRRAWAGEELVMLEGADPVRLAPLPIQQPHPPLWVAAFGPKALAQVGSLGLPYLASPVESVDALRANYAALNDACVEAGHQPPEVVPVMRSMYVSTDAAEVRALRERLSDAIAAQAKGGPAHLQKAAEANVDDIAIVGEPGFVRDQVARYVDDLGVTHLIATRLRLSGIPVEKLRLSTQRLAEILVR